MHANADNRNHWISADVLPRLLRGLGATIVVASLSLFLFMEWDGGNDLHRYLILLAQTFILAVTGLACGHWLKETNGARTFIALALTAVPVNFAILGALVYSQWGVTPALGPMPQAVTWQLSDSAGVLVAIGLGVPVLSVVSLFGFLVLARRSALVLCGLLLLINATLLVPTRDATLVGALTAGTIALLFFVLHRLSRDPAFRTHEGLIARVVLFVAPVILIGRNYWLHSFGRFLFTVLAVGLFLVMRLVSVQLSDGQPRRWLEKLSVLPALLVGLGVGELAGAANANSSLILLVVTLTIAALVFEIGLRSITTGAFYRSQAAVISIGGVLLNLLIYGGLASSVVALITGLATLLYGYTVQQRSIFALGGVAVVVSVIYQLVELVSLFNLGGWSGLALLGMSAIAAGSIIERHGALLRNIALVWRERLAGWQA